MYSCCFGTFGIHVCVTITSLYMKYKYLVAVQIKFATIASYYIVLLILFIILDEK